MSIHVVSSGETLWAISNQYGVSIPTIVQDNGLLSTQTLKPGLALYIANKRSSYFPRYYRVKTGDALWSIAQRYQTSVDQIIRANPKLNSNQLTIGQKLIIPSPVQLPLTTLGFIEPYNPEAFLTTFVPLSNQLTYIAVAAFSITEEGNAYALLKDQLIVERSKQLNVSPLLMIRNFKNGEFNPELIGSILVNPTYRNNLITSLVKLVRERRYEGVSIDFEFVPPERRNEFNMFLRQLKSALGEQILHINVHAKTEDLPTNRIVGAYDYREIGRIADIVAVMTIDYGYPTGPPDPISPIWWVEEVLRYTMTRIEPNKVQMAMALYGYDKSGSDNLTRALSVQAAQNQAITKGSSIQYDTASQSPWYQYWEDKTKHIVWFEDIRSYIEKYKLMDEYELLGTTFWQLSLPAPQNFAFLRDHITVRKKSSTRK
ncbi:LysM peptidoglycan-binding domain-containing protein [Niallia sp. XMNu-256]|uniref:LysM peptidoglycan-binding domain-containing protein n=1 Tax=Niallia sp. XMNu-256 TaxID=3082444 RepID=UPI0030CA6AAD